MKLNHSWPVHPTQIYESAMSLGIATDGALRVRDAQGRERQVHAADVSLRAA